jgi:hypothetical protein
MSQIKLSVLPKNKNNFLTTWALFYLITSIILGLLLRSLHLISLPLPYSNLLHSHSHGAFLGWVYLGLNSLLLSHFNTITRRIKTLFNIQLIILPFLFVAFSLYGYNRITIVLSSLQIITSWIISFLFIKQHGVSKLWRFNCSLSLIIAGQVFLMFSGLFPFLLGIIIKLFGNPSVLYYDTIYTYLHFQYNGFFTCTIISLVFSFTKLSIIPSKILYSFYFTFVISILLLCTHNYLWSSPPSILYYISLFGSILQLVSACYLFIIAKAIYNGVSKPEKLIITVFFFSFIIKCLLQFISSVPVFSNYLPNNRDLIIAYLHLVLIGMISCPLLFLIYKEVKVRFKLKYLLLSLIISFIGTEFFLFFRGINFLPQLFSGENWTNAIFLCSFLLFIFISIIGISIIKKTASLIKQSPK